MVVKRRITELSNLLELIESNIITVENIRNETTVSVALTETYSIKPTDFVESMQYLNEAKLFRGGIDFFYEFTCDGILVITVGMKNPYMQEVYIAECSVKDGVSINDVDAKLRENIFSKIA